MAVTAYFSFSSPTWNNRAPDCGGTRFFRSDTTAEMNALTNLMNGDRAFCIDSKLSYGRTGGAWVVEVSDAIASILIDDTLAALDVGTITDGQYLKRSGLTIASVDVQALLDAKQASSAKGQANGYASLDASSLVPVAQIPAGIPGIATWGAVIGTLSNQTDLQAALDAKAAKSANLSDLANAGTARTNLSLGNVDNTSDANKPVSTATQTALDAKVPTSRTVNGFALSSNVTITTITGNAGTATALATPRTINGVSFDGTGNITVTAAGSTLSDNVPTSKLNSGSGADATTFWRGDGSWQVPAGGSGLSQPQVMARAQFAGAF